MRQPALLGDALLIVLHNVGLLLRYIAGVPLLLVPVVALYDEWRALPAVLGMAATFFLVGFALSMLPPRREPRLREGLLIAAVGWLLVPLGSVILFIWAEGWRPLDAFVETMSAWTGTGMTLADLPSLSRTTHAWRSLMQWVGGLGVVVLTLAILARPGTGAFTLYSSEAREDKLRPSVLSTVRTLWKIYVGLTVAVLALFLLVGLPPWDAFNHALTAIGTAGMSLHAEGPALYDSLAVEMAFMLAMVAGALPFVAIYALLRRRWDGFLRDEQVRALFVVLLLAIPAVAWSLRLDAPGMPWATALREAAFQAASAITTTGFQTADIASWSEGTKLGLAGLMLVGGAAGSTAGGIKLVRGVLLLKGALWKLRRSGLPHFAVTTFRFGGERLNPQEANEEFAEAAFILVLWAALLFAGILAFLTLLPGQYDLADVIFESVSLQSNIGLTVGIVSPTLPDAAKGVVLVMMWAGRLEILPALLLLRGLLPRFGNR